ncbi:hypothetical protein GOP47_0007538 [Adiantum capillus-veneris]|uniref:STICHEL DnaA-N-like alpha-beta domain-containing protein n=1 Tax=Adiantum capillus-veneris TaxID=13818 RepID=A0A9D4V118_ADICA|nr:hypothetical protein GOP47_0007538 [Adiantum capillus-veneris]
MDEPAFVSRSSRAAYSARNPTSSHVNRSPSLSISTNTSPWFNPGLVPYSRNMPDTMEEEEHPLHTRKDPTDEEQLALRRTRDREGQHRDQYGAQVGWDWRSRKWIDGVHGSSLSGRQQKFHLSRQRQRENSADESIDGRISRLRQDANRLVNERRLVARRTSRQSSGWVSEFEGISERRRRDGYGVETLTRIKREKVGGPRGRRRASHHVLDLHNRRKLMRREFQLRRDTSMRRSKAEGEIVSALQLLGESIHSSKSFSLQTLEEYLKERAATRRLQDDDTTGSMDMASALQPASYVSSGKHTERPRRSVRKGAVIKPINETSLENNAQQPVSIYPSEDGQDEGSEAQRSGCGISWRWLNTHHVNKDDSSMPSYAGAGCFPAVSKRRIGQRLLVSRHRKGWDKYNSEGSFTSFDSDSETVPLMTEPEPFHDYTTDDVGSSVELDRNLHIGLKHKKASRFKELERYNNGHSYMKSDFENEVKEISLSMRQSGVSRHRSTSQKHRPKMFKDLVGQSMVAQSLSNAVLRGKIAPVYLFQGPRGTGKTCAARIFTAALNCLSSEDLRPCGTCKECSSFDEGKNFDVREVDAAGNSGIESMKLLLKHISLPPSSRYKVFIIDECHALTVDAWNAFLKSLEEPPSYVVFILITTDAEQLPRTALSRCQKFLFSKIKDSDIVSRLQKIALLERIDIELAALQLIASRSDGSLRDAEMTLDQISLLGKRATLSVVQELVGMIPEKKLIEFLEVALSPDTSNTVKAIRDFMESGVDALALISQLATLITDILAGNNRSAAYRLKHVRKVEDERFRQALKILSDAERQLRSCTDRTTWLTAAFLQFSQTDPSSATPYSLGTSIAQSPVNFFDTSEKETAEGDAKWESHSSPLMSERAFRGDHKRGHSQSIPHSGPLVGSKVHPCSHSPRSVTDVDDVRTMPGASRPPVVPRAFSSGLNNSDQRKLCTNMPMDSIWRKVVDNSRSNAVKQLLHGEAKLVSLSVTEALAVAHLEFRHLEHRNLAEKARTSIAKAFQDALCCPVDLKITLSSTSAEDITSQELRSPSFSRNLEQQIKPKKVVPISKGENKAYYIDEHCLSQEQRSRRSASFRKSSSSKFGVPVASSPRIRLPEPRKPQHSLDEAEENICTQRYSIELSDRERSGVLKEKIKEAACTLENRRASVHYGRASNALSLQNVDDLGGDHGIDAQSEDSFEKHSNGEHGFSPAPMEGNGYGIVVDRDGSDSEAQGPSVLCWKGSRMQDGKGKHQRLRRKRRGRLLLKLVPCAKGGRS